MKKGTTTIFTTEIEKTLQSLQNTQRKKTQETEGQIENGIEVVSERVRMYTAKWQVALATLAARLSDIEASSGRRVQFIPSHSCLALLFFSAALLLTGPPVRSFIEAIFSFGTIKDNYGMAMRISKLYTDAT